METETIIKELTQEDLVNLLCTATYSSPWLECFVEDREGLKIEDGDCREDVWAKALLAGRAIVCVDHYADGRVYGEDMSKLKQICNEGTEYYITLKDIKKGLSRCADGTFACSDDNEAAWLCECFLSYKDENSGDFDIVRADAIMQVIIFDEVIYG